MDAILGRNYTKYLRALQSIDDMMRGYFFDTENDEIQKIILHLLTEQMKNCKHMSERRGVSKRIMQRNQFIWGVLSDEIEELAEIKEEKESESNNHSRNISRKISQQFSNNYYYSSQSKALSIMIDWEEYDYFNETPKYITTLVDYYCPNMTNVCIDWANIGSDLQFFTWNSTHSRALQIRGRKAFVGELYDCIATQKKVECLDLIKKNAFFTGNGSFFYYFKMDLFCSFMITKLRWNSIHTTHHLYNTIVWLITNS